MRPPKRFKQCAKDAYRAGRQFVHDEDVQSEIAQLILTLRSNGITDQSVLSALEQTPREYFIPETFQRHAYDDSALPIGQGQTISQPLIVAMMTEALKVDKRCKVLEIGTGSGYQAAILSRLSRRVYTVERHKPLLREAESLFKHFDLHNIATRFGDGMEGWPEQAPFDRIIVTAAPEEVPAALLSQLKEGGRIVVPVGAEGRPQQLFVGQKGPFGFDWQEICDVRFVPLVPGVEQGRA